MVRCRQCNAELIEQAHFCNACGLPQNPPKPELEISTLIEQKTPDSMSLKPARSIKPVDKQLTKTSDNVSIRPKTVTRPPVFPTRPTNTVKTNITSSNLSFTYTTHKSIFVYKTTNSSAFEFFVHAARCGQPG